MYAIAFDLDNDILSKTYGSASYNNAYTDIRNTLAQYGFIQQQESFYLGLGYGTNAVTAVIATQALAKKYNWFVPSIKYIQMFRIEEDSNLMPALKDIK